MSTSADPSSAPSAQAAAPTPVRGAPRSRRSGAQRVAIGLGVAIAIVGALLAVAGGGILAVFGFDGVASTARDELSTPTSALVSATASIDTGGFVDHLGSARITINARSDRARRVFVGVGRASDVDGYLSGAAIDEVTDLNAGPFRSRFSIQRERHPGNAIPAPPGAQRFWIAQGSGRASAAVDWRVRDGDYRIVVMNTDGSRGVATHTKFGVDISYIPWVGIGILVAGLLVTGGGLACIAMAARRP